MLNDDAFARLVAEDVKNRVSKDQSEYLRLPENQQRWRDNLAALVLNLNEQVQAIEEQEKEELSRIKDPGRKGKALLVETQANFEEKRKKINRFRFHVENKLAEADRLIALGDEGLSDDLKLANFLSKAIDTHREMMLEHDIEPTPLDTALWHSLEGRWDFLDIDPADLP